MCWKTLSDTFLLLRSHEGGHLHSYHFEAMREAICIHIGHRSKVLKCLSGVSTLCLLASIQFAFSQCGSFHGSELQGSCSLQFLFSCLSILVSSCCPLDFCVDFLGAMCLFLVCGIRCWILIKFVWINAFRRSLLTRSLPRSALFLSHWFPS